jgi:beta-lactamase class A
VRAWLLLTIAGLLLGVGITLATTKLASEQRRQPSPSRSTPSAHLSRRALPRLEPHASDGGRALPWRISPTARRSFARLQASLPGPVGVAIAPLDGGPVRELGSAQRGHAWSTMKVPVIVAYLNRLGVAEHMPDELDDTDIELAIEQSDNEAVNAVFSRLETLDGGLVAASEAIERELRGSGDNLTVVNTIPNEDGFSTFGQTEWSLSASALFYRALARGCLTTKADASWILKLMSRITPVQRWGAGEAGVPRGIRLAFKGGWGPQATGAYLVRQTAIIGAGSSGYVLAALAEPPGTGSVSFQVGQAMLTKAAKWAFRALHPHGETQAPPCTRG